MLSGRVCRSQCWCRCSTCEQHLHNRYSSSFSSCSDGSSMYSSPTAFSTNGPTTGVGKNTIATYAAISAPTTIPARAARAAETTSTRTSESRAASSPTSPSATRTYTSITTGTNKLNATRLSTCSATSANPSSNSRATTWFSDPKPRPASWHGC